MKRVVVMLAAIILCMAIAGCTLDQNGKKTNSVPTEVVDNTVETTDNFAGSTAKVIETARDAVDGGDVSKAYDAYSGVKTEFLTKLVEALTQNEDTVWDSVSLLPLVSVDLDLIPITLLSQGKVSLVAGMAFTGATEIEYSENGDSYSVNYSDKDGAPCLLSATYNAGADAMVCTNAKNGKENIYAEYCMTPFGYVAQYYLVDEKGGASLYQLSLSGDDGMMGIAQTESRPSALTGVEAADFPKACSEWYAITGQTVTAGKSDGTVLSFDYISASAE